MVIPLTRVLSYIMKIFHTKLDKPVLNASLLDTPLGSMLAVADDSALFVLRFVEESKLELELKILSKKMQSVICLGKTVPIVSIEQELKIYFAGTLKEFRTPLLFWGSEFQKTVWNKLCHVPYGETRSYAELASVIGKKTAYRAVANANGANRFAIVVPCHRIINSNGDIGGYNGGVERKKWLIRHESCNLYKMCA